MSLVILWRSELAIAAKAVKLALDRAGKGKQGDDYGQVLLDALNASWVALYHLADATPHTAVVLGDEPWHKRSTKQVDELIVVDGEPDAGADPP